MESVCGETILKVGRHLASLQLFDSRV